MLQKTTSKSLYRYTFVTPDNDIKNIVERCQHILNSHISSQTLLLPTKDEVKTGKHRIILAKLKNRILGFIHYTTCREFYFRKGMKLNYICVSMWNQRNGHGSQLFKMMLRDAIFQGCRFVINNGGATPSGMFLYKKYGAKQVWPGYWRLDLKKCSSV